MQYMVMQLAQSHSSKMYLNSLAAFPLLLPGNYLSVRPDVAVTHL